MPFNIFKKIADQLLKNTRSIVKKCPIDPLKIIMDEDVQMVDVNEPERESDKFEDGAKESFNRPLC